MTSMDSFAWQGLSGQQYGFVGFYNPDYGVGEVGREAVAPWFMATKKGQPLYPPMARSFLPGDA